MDASRRHLLRLIAALPLLAGSRYPARADRTATIASLIERSHPLSSVAQRIDFISARLLGARYQADTLVGAPNRPEKFVVRDDAFDCMTYCEIVLAAALGKDFDDFKAVLRRLRYDRGEVRYDHRNHYFSDWCRRNIENGTCQPVPIGPSMTIEKTLTWHREFGRHRVLITAISRSTLFDHINLLAAGDIVGFVSRRPGLDYYHTGLIALGKRGEVLLRHASQKHGRVIEETLQAFATTNPVGAVSLLRVVQDAALVERH